MCRVTSASAEPSTTTTTTRPAMSTELPEYPFTVQSLKAAIPAHCWERNVVKSVGYAVRDFIFVGALWAIAGWLQNHAVLGHGVFWWMWYLPWVFAQGTVFWALFVVGHDCGHGSFSDHPKLNDLVGHITHTFILAPYHPWRITHRRHHMNTGNLDRDAAFVALSESEYRSLPARIRAFRYELFWVFGFFVYLLVGMPGSWGTHFSTDSPAFVRCPSEYQNIRTSLAWWWGWLCLLHIPMYLAPKALLLYYFMPWAAFISWISVVTHLHHTDAEVPWYRGKDWTYLRGALSTVDRSYGALIDHIHHDIGTHVIHHLFIHVPHYNLREATAALKPVLGSHYRRIQTNPITSLWENCVKCRFVPDEGGMVYYTK